jgi:hypothetical protein
MESLLPLWSFVARAYGPHVVLLVLGVLWGFRGVLSERIQSPDWFGVQSFAMLNTNRLPIRSHAAPIL